MPFSYQNTWNCVLCESIYIILLQEDKLGRFQTLSKLSLVSNRIQVAIRFALALDIHELLQIKTLSINSINAIPWFLTCLVTSNKHGNFSLQT